MTDVQPDYTPFLNLVRPDTHDDIRTTVNKLRDALDAVDAWAAAQGGGGGVSYGEPLAAMRVVNAATPLDPDGNVLVQPTDGTLLVDASGGGLSISFPDSPVGTAWRVIRTDDGTSANTVNLTTPNSSSASFLNAGTGGGNLTVLSAGEAVTAESDGTNWWLTDAVGAPLAAAHVVSVSADYTVLRADRYVLVDASAGTATITLPVSFDPGAVVTVIRTDEVDADGTQVAVVENGGSVAINGRNPFYIFARGAFEFVFDGFDWHGSSSPFDFTAVGPSDVTTGTYVPQLQPPGFGPRGWHLDTLRLQQLAEMGAFSPLDGQVLYWDAGQNAWSVKTITMPSAGATHLDDLLDVQIGTLNDQDLLRYNGTDGQWEDVAAYQLGLASPQTVFPATSFGVGTINTSAPPGAPTVFIVTCDSGDLTIQLPTAASAHDSSSQASGQVTAKKVDNTPYAMIVAAQPGETIDGAATFVVMTQYEAVTVVSDGTEWWVV